MKLWISCLRTCAAAAIALMPASLADAQTPAGRTAPPPAPLGASAAAGAATAGKAKVRYTNAYAVLVPASHTLILACLDKALTPQDLEKVAAFARRETTGVFKNGLATVSTAILEVTMRFKPGTASAAVSALEGFDLTLSNEPVDWTYRFPTDPVLLKMNASVSGNTARLVDLGGALQAGGRVRGRLTGSGRDPREDPATPLVWDIAFDAVVTVAR